MSNLYETWVRRLRAWAKDPTVTLDGLPAYNQQTFTVAVHERLIKHMNKALEIIDDLWARAVTNPPEFTNTQEYERWWIQCRNQLARRMQLCNHSALPEEVRAGLRLQAEGMITGWQTTIEDQILHGSLAPADAEIGYNIIHNAPLTAILDPTFGTAERINPH